ncbi:protein takeout-like [Zophobas morio]
MYGLKDIQMQDATFNLEDMSMNYTGFLPKLKILGNYRLNGRVLLLPIVGRGNCTIILTNLTAVVHFPLEKIQKKGEIYIRITASKELKIPNLGRLYMHLENLFDGNKELGDTLNTVLNENWNSIWDDVRSGWEIFFAETVARIYNRFFAKVPLREMVDNLDPKFLA